MGTCERCGRHDGDSLTLAGVVGGRLCPSCRRAFDAFIGESAEWVERGRVTAQMDAAVARGDGDNAAGLWDEANAISTRLRVAIHAWIDAGPGHDTGE